MSEARTLNSNKLWLLFLLGVVLISKQTVLIYTRFKFFLILLPCNVIIILYTWTNWFEGGNIDVFDCTLNLINNLWNIIKTTIREKCFINCDKIWKRVSLHWFKCRNIFDHILWRCLTILNKTKVFTICQSI